MQLYLVQHGAAKSEAEDPQRSLTAEGTKTIEGMAKYLSSLKLHVCRIEHSGKDRARQTAEIIAAHLRPEVVHDRSLVYLLTTMLARCAKDCRMNRAV